MYLAYRLSFTQLTFGITNYCENLYTSVVYVLIPSDKTRNNLEDLTDEKEKINNNSQTLDFLNCNQDFISTKCLNDCFRNISKGSIKLK